MLQILSDKKKFLTKDTCRDYNFPTLPETSIEKLWPLVEQDKEIRAYLPDTWDKPKRADR